jgi:8-oxo-dGTP pyrophosphatase MutT (NUDIX family)
MSDWETIRETVERRTEDVLAEVTERWGPHERRDPFTYGPKPFDPDGPPETVAEQLATMAGIVSTVVFDTPERRQTVLVYNPHGGWEPPGGRIEPDQTPEETARAEVREETGVEVELDEVLYTRRVEYVWESGHSVTLPVVQFAGHRTDGHLRVERDGDTHPEVSRFHPGISCGTGLFDAETLPELRRDGDLVADLLAEPPEWDPDDPPLRS